METDVLVIGGGMAAAWAAISAAQEGAAVILADKGFVGTSGVTATGGPGHWWMPPDPALREAAIDKRHKISFGLADRTWMARVIDTTWRTLPLLAGYYRFDVDDRGQTYYQGLRGPEYMRALRRYALDRGVTILDHHPALELLLHGDGSVAGAAGFARLTRRPWTIRSGAVIVATGGTAFRSGLIGSHNNTGDGHLMAAEAGAELSGMEFSVAYSLSPVWNSTRILPYMAARFYDGAGAELDIPPSMAGPAYLKGLASALLTGPVYADLADAPALLKEKLRRIQPASPTPFDRRGLRLFEDRFEIKLFGEGTVRGTGGLRIVGDCCQTTVPGLFAAGDTATRELVAGATSGGGAQNSAWALTSGLAAGVGASDLALAAGRRTERKVTAVGGAGLRPTGIAKSLDEQEAIGLVQTHTLSYDTTLWRRRETLQSSKAALDGAWDELARHLQGDGLGQVAARETAALTAMARWTTTAALAREESRGMHMRADLPATSPALARRLLVGGLDSVWTRYERETHAGAKTEAAA